MGLLASGLDPESLSHKNMEFRNGQHRCCAENVQFISQNLATERACAEQGFLVLAFIQHETVQTALSGLLPLAFMNFPCI